MPIPAQQSPVVRTTARERVFKALQEWIIDGTLLPEERLNDAELAKYFSVSRTPVREALQMLAEQKLVTMVPSSGTFVAPIDLHDMAYVYELLGILQANAIDLGLKNITEDDLSHLWEINQEFYRCANYNSGRGTCNIHYIRNVVLEQIVAEAVGSLADFVRCYETIFLYMLAKTIPLHDSPRCRS